MNRTLLALAALAASSTGALAADMPVVAADEAVVASQSDWGGFFVGVQGGYAWGEAGIETSTGFESEYDIDGFVGGLLFGRNWQFDNIVLGLDSSVSIADVEGGDTDGAGTIEGFSATRLKLGYAIDNFLVFIAGGFSLARVEVDPEAPFDLEAESEWAKGWTIGGGVETKFSENWSGRVEALYIDYSDVDFDFTLPVDVDGDLDASPDMVVVRGGVAYHF